MFHPPPHPRLRGFSLVELSIVLVLISLLVGGIMAGLNLKHSAELKSLNEETVFFRQVVSAFKDRFEGLPGDLYNAQKFWGVQNADANACKTSASNSVKTCNGDGNGWVTTPGVSTTYYEAHRFWQHLANAQLIDGRFTGQRAGTGTDVTCLSNTHCASSKFKNGVYYAGTVNSSSDYFNTSSYSPALNLFPGDKGNVLLLFRNSVVAATGALVGSPLLTAEDAFNLDTKTDDGKPGTGFMQTFQPAPSASYLTNSCASGTDPKTAIYVLTSKGAQCAPVFINAF